MMTSGSLTVISGFSGAGKGTIMKTLLQRYPEYALSVSATTREPRPGEQDGVDYFFVSQEQFDRMVEENGLLEHAGYIGHSYGTPRQYVEDQMAAGKDVILEIDVQGAHQIRQACPEAILLFVTTPSAAELRHRLSGRGTESEEVIRKRLKRAVEEAKEIPSYDYLIVNDDLDRAVETVHRSIQEAKNAPFRRRVLVEEITRELKELSEL